MADPTGGPILTEKATPSDNPASGKQFFFASNDTPSRFKRLDSGGNVYISQEFAQIVLSSDYTLTDNNTAQKAFNAPTNGAITLPSATTWDFEGLYLMTNVGTTSHTWAVLFAGTAVTAAVDFGVMFGDAGITSPATPATVKAVEQAATTLPTTALVLTTASTSATEHLQVRIRGTVRVTTAGTFIPQVKLSAATTGASKMLRGSFFKMSPVGSDTVQSQGNWS